MAESRFQKRSIFLIAYIIFALLPVYWMVNMCLQDQRRNRGQLQPVPAAFHLGKLPHHL